MLVVNTNKIGAYKSGRDHESQQYSINVVDNIYKVEPDRIPLNQMMGRTPKHSIPLSNNAITVQGISYSDPYFSSFNLNYSKMALGAPENINKSDYAFKNSVTTVKSDCCMKTMQQTHELARDDIKATRTRMITNDKSKTIYHDNKGSNENETTIMRNNMDSDLSIDELLKLVLNEEQTKRSMMNVIKMDSWGNPKTMRLCGGGESSLNAASGWGSPPVPSNNAGNWGGNPAGQANNGMNSQQWNSAQRPPTSQADGANSGNGGNSPNSTASTNGPIGGNGNGSSSANKIEQLNSMREALFSQDGWGGQHVNQDTNWDVPGSPEPGVKVDPAAGGPPPWKPNVNNGAFLGTDLWEANLRNGGQPPPQPVAKTPWGHTPTTNIGGTWGEDDDPADSANVWTGPPPGPQQWGAAPPQQAQQWRVPKKDDWNAWGEPPRPNDLHYEHRAAEQRPPADPRMDLRGGISGRLNGDMWGQHHQHTAPPNKMMPNAPVNQWPPQGPKEPMKASGWEEPSPPAARRAASTFDDGTSLWGGRGARPTGAGRGMPAKSDGWPGQGPRNGAWDEHSSWAEREPGWPDTAPPALWPPKAKPGPGWPEDIGEWSGAKPPHAGALGKQIPKEMLYNSKQFRLLIEMGYKKEEAEAALRSRDMNVEEALEVLSAARGEGWRRDEPFGQAPFQQGVPPAIVQKLLNQPPPPTPQHHHSYNPNGGSGNGSGGQPSTAQLRMLVQQIQMAVSAGYLNHQILNQPLAPQTLVLLNQLLQQIKVLQQLVQQHTVALTKGPSTAALPYSMQISKVKQQITALQNQIATQQALYMKQQSGGGTDLFKQSPDPMPQLQNNFNDMNIAKDTQPSYGASSTQQSRLNQWKLPSLDKDVEGSEFSRAPGTAKSATSPIGLQPDSTWGVGRGAEGWGDTGGDLTDGKDWPSHQSHQPVYDLVPEFEPGKPWKGNQMKNAEDDPAMTPGSVGRAPLGLKEPDLLPGKTSPPQGERSLSSSTWSYAPPASGAQPLKQSDAWAGKSRSQPPPGLNKPWPQQHQSQSRNLPTWQASTWLLLKNLTAQIDGSTLKTLCLQHGPLQNFHLYLNQGIALARYSSREEAAKAQMALNNCVLSNTTIFAESPAESEVQMILQHLGAGGGGAWPRKEGWFPSLWPDSHEQRATPSSLNSFLPPDLLGGESI